MIEAGNLVLVNSGRVHLSPPPQPQSLLTYDPFKVAVLRPVAAAILTSATAFGDNLL
jgi:hypothetical protein